MANLCYKPRKKLFIFPTPAKFAIFLCAWHFFLFKQQTQRKHCWEEIYMLQIKKDADLNLLHKEVSIAIVLHAES